LSAPARIPPPSAADEVAGPGATPPADQQAAATAFLEALLTGSGEAAGYLAASAHVEFFDNPPYASVHIAILGTDHEGTIRARVEATSTSGAITRLDYVLRMAIEDNSWVVVDVGLKAAS
jgi:hypothetical protein